jgi:hypothetical protein
VEHRTHVAEREHAACPLAALPPWSCIRRPVQLRQLVQSTSSLTGLLTLRSAGTGRATCCNQSRKIGIVIQSYNPQIA